MADESEIRLKYLSEAEYPRILAYIVIPGLGELRFNKFGADPWYAEAFTTEDGQELLFYDDDWPGDEYAPQVSLDSKFNALLEAALDRQPELRQRAIDDQSEEEWEVLRDGAVTRFYATPEGGSDGH